MLAMGAGIGLALWNQNTPAPATYVAHRAIITDSGANRMPVAASLEATIGQAKSGGVVELKAGTFATALTVRKPVRLVAVDGAVRIGVNADSSPRSGLDTTHNAS